ncbi:uncharacterized protein LOC122614049 [Drosophila teissieri]|uniref:uncharacterized protein LOC122614049 n=1 Tax=Drosophila teissieri TaxID=7243 RepID=UPI001CBA238B|nr:uncharacterized protein LOC122614049 [Drosophila teissieri]
MLNILLFWFLLHIFGLIQGRSVGEGFEYSDDEFFKPQPDETIFAYNQTDKELPWDLTWN